ncbi:MAG: 23S rRNA pseudouridylate synthase B [Proteobacteria bacterium]|nr:23S rRNA pseudouridylate synthase B [Pseudomonadota bacterium]
MARAPARRGGGRRAAAPGTAAGRGTPARAGEPERLQKMLARVGLASRREAEAWIRAGRLTVNSLPATLGMKVGPADQVRLDGRPVRVQAQDAGARVFICHRSPGEPLRTPDAASPQPEARLPRQALLERLPRRAGRRFISISPMPRVDGGLELVTSDGALAERLQRRVHTLTGEFGVRVRGELTEANLSSILGGELDSGERLQVERCEPAGGEGANRWYTLVARGASGKQVRQLFERTGALVSRVQRVRLGPLALERALGRSQFRELTQEELAALLAAPAAAAGADWASKEPPLTP